MTSGRRAPAGLTVATEPAAQFTFSHITFTVPARELLTDTVTFYQQLGFMVVFRESQRVCMHLFPSAGDVAADEEAAPTTTTLHSMPVRVAPTRLPCGTFHTAGLTIQLVLAEAASASAYDADAAHQRIDTIRAQLAADPDRVLMSDRVSWLTFGCTDIDRLAQLLDAMQIPTYRPNHGAVGVDDPSAVAAGAAGANLLFVLDPLGQVIGFSVGTPAWSHRAALPALPLPTRAGTPMQTPLHPNRPMTPMTATSSPSEAAAAAIRGAAPPHGANSASASPSAPMPGKRIGILTSGGDSSGMNAAVRAVVRVALQRGCRPYIIHEGYEGLVQGGKLIQEARWQDVQGLLAVGGTVIGTARCKSFRERHGRLDAACNLVQRKMDALVVCGGDGSLTGADLLRSEWPSLLEELAAAGRIEPDAAVTHGHLSIVGMVGSIDNDMCSTDLTIGAATSLHRICECLDSLSSTAMSHQRAFVVEVMGRHCGWLGMMAAISTGADWVFLPECPPPLCAEKYGEDWQTEMCDRLSQQRSSGKRITIIIVCEGAIDTNLRPIRAEDIKTCLESRLQLDTRVTTLGHIQRGGTPCFADRYVATVQGVAAVDAVLRDTPDTPAPMIGMQQNEVISTPLMEAVRLTRQVADHINQRDFPKAMQLRDPGFARGFRQYMALTTEDEGHHMKPSADHGLVPLPIAAGAERVRIGIIHTGAPAGGMNAATRTAVRIALKRGYEPVGIHNGFSGLVRDEVRPLTWSQVEDWQTLGGSQLGTNRDHPRPFDTMDEVSPKGIDAYVDLGQIAYSFQKHRIGALLIMGGFEALTAELTLSKARRLFPAFRIPMILLPATVSNNVPGTDFSIGTDTALNVIVQSCDQIKTSANASRKRVFVVEVQGGNCGCLAVLGGLATGATAVYTPEQGINLRRLDTDVRHLRNKYADEDAKGLPNEGRIILRTENASKTYSTDLVAKILESEGRGQFDARTTILGHLQQGGVPSPLDRVRATSLAVECVAWLDNQLRHTRTASGAAARPYGVLPQPHRADADTDADTLRVPLAAAHVAPHVADALLMAKPPQQPHGSASSSSSSPAPPSPAWPPRGPTPAPDESEAQATADLQRHAPAKPAPQPATAAPQPPERFSLGFTGADTSVIVGIRRAEISFMNIEEAMARADVRKRRPTDSWWAKLGDLIRTLAISQPGAPVPDIWASG